MSRIFRRIFGAPFFRAEREMLFAGMLDGFKVLLRRTVRFNIALHVEEALRGTGIGLAPSAPAMRRNRCAWSGGWTDTTLCPAATISSWRLCGGASILAALKSKEA